MEGVWAEHREREREERRAESGASAKAGRAVNRGED